MSKEERRYLLIIPIILLFLIIVSTFFSFKRSGFITLSWLKWPRINPFSKKPTTSTTRPTTSTTLPSSLINDNNYVQNKTNAFLQNNPKANENYARDVVYYDIARIEKKRGICEKINNDYLKRSCYNSVF